MLLIHICICRINENDLFKQDWRSRSRAQVLQYIILKWSLAFLVGLLTGIIATLINLAVENIAGYKLLAVVDYIQQERSEQQPLQPHFLFYHNENSSSSSSFFLFVKA